MAFGHLLQRAFRASDIFCRYGGEEFAVLLGNCSLDNARDIMEQLRTRTHRLTLNLTDGRQVRFTTSCGIAPVNAFTALQAAIKQADEALYFCKRTARIGSAYTLRSGLSDSLFKIINIIIFMTN